MLPVFEPGMGCAKGWFVMDEKMLARFMAKVVVNAETGCWEWTAAKRRGYGAFGVGASKLLPAHRLAYGHFVGAIPDGLQLDHLCRNRACCNPAHLEPVTNRENTLRGMSPPATTYRSQTCARGHKRTAENVRMILGGTVRVCRLCKRMSEARVRAAARG